MESLQRAVLERIDANWESEQEFLAELVAQASVLGEEAGAQRRIAAELADLGLQADLWELDPLAITGLPGYSPPEWSYRKRPNLSATMSGSGKGGRSLIFNGHVDVVPASPEHHWRHEPWRATVVGDRMYGRGAADMKSGIAAMVFAVRAIREAGITLDGDLLIDTVIEEECTGNGTLAALARGRTADAALIPEPFNHTLLVAQVGVLWARVVVQGRGAHVLGAERAVNAIHKAQIVIEAIRDLERAVNRQVERPEEFAALPHPLNYNVGTIRAGDWPSSVPPECTLEVRLSAFPGEDLERVGARFREHLLNSTGQDEWLADHPPEVEFFAFRAEGCTLDQNGPLFSLLEDAHARVLGGKPARYASTATTDARFYSLYHDVPVTCYGPIGGNLHAPDEWVDLPSVRNTTAVLALAALEWCGAG